WIWAKVTAANSATPPKYSWTQVVPDGAGGFTVAGDGASGTDTSGPAYEINGEVISSFPVYVQLYLGPDWFYFDANAGGGGGGSLEVLSYNPGAGDSSVDVTGVTRILVDQASGLQVESFFFLPYVYLSAQPASYTHAGVVTTTHQVMGQGTK